MFESDLEETHINAFFLIGDCLYLLLIFFLIPHSRQVNVKVIFSKNLNSTNDLMGEIQIHPNQNFISELIEFTLTHLKTSIRTLPLHCSMPSGCLCTCYSVL